MTIVRGFLVGMLMAGAFLALFGLGFLFFHFDEWTFPAVLVALLTAGGVRIVKYRDALATSRSQHEGASS